MRLAVCLLASLTTGVKGMTAATSSTNMAQDTRLKGSLATTLVL